MQIVSEPMIAIGMSRPGSRVSSLPVATASKPMYAKKMIDAPVMTPLNPSGANGEKLSVVNAVRTRRR